MTNRSKHLLDELATRGKPLAEVSVELYENEEPRAVAESLDSLADDISAGVFPAYFQPTEEPTISRIYLEATKEALAREFGWEIEREKIYDSSEHDGQHPDAYWWKEITGVKKYPDSLDGKIKQMCLVQPGNSDNGLIDNISYVYEPDNQRTR